MNTLKAGDNAPFFTLQNQNDETVELKTLLESNQSVNAGLYGSG